MNFKKCTSFILALYLLVSTSGLAFNVHYCKGEIAAVSSVFEVEESCAMQVEHEEKSCCAKPSKDHSGCCSDELIQVDFDDVIIKQINFEFEYVSILPVLALPIFTAREKIITSTVFRYYFDSNAPPLYQLYSQFVFYA